METDDGRSALVRVGPDGTDLSVLAWAPDDGGPLASGTPLAVAPDGRVAMSAGGPEIEFLVADAPDSGVAPVRMPLLWPHRISALLGMIALAALRLGTVVAGWKPLLERVAAVHAPFSYRGLTSRGGLSLSRTVEPDAAVTMLDSLPGQITTEASVLALLVWAFLVVRRFPRLGLAIALAALLLPNLVAIVVQGPGAVGAFYWMASVESASMSGAQIRIPSYVASIAIIVIAWVGTVVHGHSRRHPHPTR